MRYLVFGDVHGNVHALDAVLAAGQQRVVDAWLFVGDLVGYGPSPLECIRRMVELQKQGRLAWVLGNHERTVRGESQRIGYSAEAVATLDWTRNLIEAEPWAKQFVASGHLTAQINGLIWLTHDSIADPGNTGYHHWPQNARTELLSLRAEGGRVCFYGHTHAMRAELMRGDNGVVLAPMIAHEGEGRDPTPLRLKEGELAWVGVGSTGLPTNPKRLAEYLILDDAEWAIEKYAAAYPRHEVKELARRVLSESCGAVVGERIARWL
jgi:predicted phosphodiesterase